MVIKEKRLVNQHAYVAHILMRVAYEGLQTSCHISLWENLHLIKASSEAEAWSEAEKIGKSSEKREGYWVDERPAQLLFAGVRKLHSLAGLTLRHKTELTAMQLEVAHEKDLQQLLHGKTVSLICYDDFDS